MHDAVDVFDESLPIAYEIDSGTQILYAAVGPWTPEAVGRWVSQLMEDPAYIPGMRAMVNLRFAAGPMPSVSTVERIAEALLPITTIPARTRWAFLVASEAMHDRVRLLETLTSGGHVQLRAFDDEDTAIRWLGLEHRRSPWLVRA